MGDGALGHERQHGVGPAEGDEGRLSEEDGDVGEGPLAGESQHEADWADPERREDQGQDREPPDDGAHADGGGRFRVGRRGVGGWGDDCAQPVGDQADQKRGADDPRKTDPQQAKAHEGPDGQAPGQRRLQRTASDPHACRGHQGHDDWQHAPEGRLQGWKGAVRGRQPGQGEEHAGAGQDEQPAGRQGAAQPVQLEAKVGGQLLGFRPRQQHAEIQRRGEGALIDPSPPLDQFFMQDGDLAGGPAERDQADLQPQPQGVGEPGRSGGDRRNGRRPALACDGGLLAHTATLAKAASAAVQLIAPMTAST